MKMKAVTSWRLVAILVIICILSSSVSGVRKRRCYYKFCRKCSLYVHARYTRSLSESEQMESVADESLFPGDFNDLKEDLGGRLTTDDLKFFPDLDGKANNHLISQMEKVGAEGKFSKNYASHVQKRSTFSHMRRCLFLINTPCCRRFQNTMFIGYVKS